MVPEYENCRITVVPILRLTRTVKVVRRQQLASLDLTMQLPLQSQKLMALSMNQTEVLVVVVEAVAMVEVEAVATEEVDREVAVDMEAVVVVGAPQQPS